MLLFTIVVLPLTYHLNPILLAFEGGVGCANRLWARGFNLFFESLVSNHKRWTQPSPEMISSIYLCKTQVQKHKGKKFWFLYNDSSTETLMLVCLWKVVVRKFSCMVNLKLQQWFAVILEKLDKLKKLIREW